MSLFWYSTRRIFFILFLALATTAAYAQEITQVEEIRQSPTQYLNEVVTVEGYATQYIENPAESSSFYYLKDDYGGIITVRTTREAPEVGQRYTVSGPVGTDPRRNDPYISEESRVSVATEASNAGGSAGGSEPLVSLLVGAIGLVFVILLGVLFYLVQSRKEDDSSAQESRSSSGDAPSFASANESPSPASGAPAANGVAANGEAAPDPEKVIEDKTIKMHAPPQGTLKILPGRLQVRSGLDDISEIRFYKPKAQDETNITFGRSEGKPYQHIQLKPRTVSSKQAELVFDEDAERYTVVNYATKNSNPTRVNGTPLGNRESAPLKDGDRLTMGEVEFEFAAN